MIKLTNKITITSGSDVYTIDFLNDYQSTSSYVEFTDKGSIILPNRRYFNDDPIVNGANALFKVGDEIKIECGYDFKYETFFHGYITSIDPTRPMRIYFEDDMYLLKQKAVDETFGKKKNGILANGGEATISNIVDKIVGDTDYEITADQELISFRFSRTNAAEVLRKLMSYEVYSFFRYDEDKSKNILYVGNSNPASLSKTLNFDFEKNIISDTLTWQTSSDYRLKLRGKIIKPNNEVEIVEVGDEGGDVKELTYYNQTKSRVIELLTNRLEESKYTGFKGSFTTFIYPKVNHGDIVVLNSRFLPERNGSYIVRKVTYRSGLGGGRQTVELGQRI